MVSLFPQDDSLERFLKLRLNYQRLDFHREKRNQSNQQIFNIQVKEGLFWDKRIKLWNRIQGCDEIEIELHLEAQQENFMQKIQKTEQSSELESTSVRLLERYCSEEAFERPTEIPSILLGKKGRMDQLYQEILASELQKSKSAIILLQTSKYETSEDLSLLIKNVIFVCKLQVLMVVEETTQQDTAQRKKIFQKNRLFSVLVNKLLSFAKNRPSEPSLLSVISYFFHLFHQIHILLNKQQLFQVYGLISVVIGQIFETSVHTLFSDSKVEFFKEIGFAEILVQFLSQMTFCQQKESCFLSSVIEIYLRFLQKIPLEKRGLFLNEEILSQMMSALRSSQKQEKLMMNYTNFLLQNHSFVQASEQLPEVISQLFSYAAAEGIVAEEVISHIVTFLAYLVPLSSLQVLVFLIRNDLCAFLNQFLTQKPKLLDSQMLLLLNSVNQRALQLGLAQQLVGFLKTQPLVTKVYNMYLNDRDLNVRNLCETVISFITTTK